MRVNPNFSPLFGSTIGSDWAALQDRRLLELGSKIEKLKVVRRQKRLQH